MCKCKHTKEKRDAMGIRNIILDWMVSDPEKCRELLSVRFPELKLGTGTEENTPILNYGGRKTTPM